MTKITGLRTVDVRFPTSQHLDGSDAMNPDPDYSAAYVILETDGPLEGHGLTFTIGRGNEIAVAAIQAMRPVTASCAGSDRTRGRSTLPPVPLSTRSGISGPSWRASRSGNWSPT
jgi:hypothetical protein